MESSDYFSLDEILEEMLSGMPMLGLNDIKDALNMDGAVDEVWIRGKLMFSNISDSSQILSNRHRGIMIKDAEIINEKIIIDHSTKKIKFEKYDLLKNDKTNKILEIDLKRFKNNITNEEYKKVLCIEMNRALFFMYSIIDITDINNIVRYSFLDNSSLTYEPAAGSEIIMQIVCSEKGIYMGCNVFIKNMIGPDTKKIRDNVKVVSNLMKENKLLLDKYANHTLYGDDSFKIQLPESIIKSSYDYIKEYSFDKIYSDHEELTDIVNKVSLIDIYEFMDKSYQIENQILYEMKKSELIVIYTILDSVIRKFAHHMQGKCDYCRHNNSCSNRGECSFYFSNKIQRTTKAIIDRAAKIIELDSADIELFDILNDVRNFSIHADKRENFNEDELKILCERVNRIMAHQKINNHRIAEASAHRYDINYLTRYVCLMASSKLPKLVNAVAEYIAGFEGCVAEKCNVDNNTNNDNSFPDLDSLSLFDAVKLFKKSFEKIIKEDEQRR